MRRIWIITLLLLLTGCGTAAAEAPEKAATTVETAQLADGRVLRAETAVVPGQAGGSYHLTVTVYEDADLSAPVQVIQDTVGWPTAAAHWSDANFDGYPDIRYTTHTSARNSYAAWWLWDTETGRFERSEALSGLDVCPDGETERLTQWEEWTARTYACRVYAWQEGQLVCLRQLEVREGNTPDGLTATYAERRHGELTPLRTWEYRDGTPGEEETALYLDALFLGEGEKPSALLENMGERTLYVTGEWTEASENVQVRIRVCDTSDLTKPIQEMEDEVGIQWEHLYVQDCNFDGYGDFSYTNVIWASGGDSHYWLWDPEAEKFELDDSLYERPMLLFDSEQKVVEELHNGPDGDTYIFYRWEDGELVPVRTASDRPYIETWQREFTVTDYIGGEEVVVYNKLWTDAGKRKEGETDLEYRRYFDLDYKG